MVWFFLLVFVRLVFWLVISQQVKKIFKKLRVLFEIFVWESGLRLKVWNLSCLVLWVIRLFELVLWFLRWIGLQNLCREQNFFLVMKCLSWLSWVFKELQVIVLLEKLVQLKLLLCKLWIGKVRLFGIFLSGLVSIGLVLNRQVKSQWWVIKFWVKWKYKWFLKVVKLFCLLVVKRVVMRLWWSEKLMWMLVISFWVILYFVFRQLWQLVIY